MNYSSVTLRHAVAIVVLTITAALTLSGCSSTSGPTNPAIATRAAAPAPCTRWCFYTVNASTSSNQNNVTGINNSREIVGDYAASGTGASTVWQPYTSLYSGGAGNPYVSFSLFNWPTAPAGTYMAGISTASTNLPAVEVGYVASSSDISDELGPGSWAVVDNGGLWSAIHQVGDEASCSTTPFAELMAFDGNLTSVGYRTNKSCVYIPYEVKNGDKTNSNRFSHFSWTANTEATGIDSSDDIVGTTQGNSSSGTSAGWYFPNATSDQPPLLRCCGTTSETYATSFTGIAAIGATHVISIVGSYTTGGKTHGLIYNPAETGSSAWTTVDEPNAHNDAYTVINGINTNGDICGWYKDSSGNIDGFVGIVVAIAGNHRRRHQ
jgi:hypothetical protein